MDGAVSPPDPKDEIKADLDRVKSPPGFTGFLSAIIAIGDMMTKRRRCTFL